MEFEPNPALARRRRLTQPLKRLVAAGCRLFQREGRAARPLPPGSRVLALALNRGVGDLLLLSPALQALVDRFGAGRVTVLTRSAALGAWLERLLDGGEIVAIDRFASGRAAAAHLRRCGFDVAADFVFGDWRTQVLARRSGARETWGLDIGLGTLCGRAVAPPPDAHAAEMWRRLASALGGPEPRPASIRLRPEERRGAEARLLAAGVKERQVVVGFHPGARDDVDVLDKRWPVEHWADLARQLAARQARVVVFGTAAEADRLRPLREASPQVLWLVGCTSLPGASAMIERLDLLVGSNSCFVHVAAALGVPTVSFGSGVYLPRWRPHGPAHLHHVMMASPTCDPARCWECRWAGRACLASIEPHEVLGWAEIQLAARRRTPARPVRQGSPGRPADAAVTTFAGAALAASAGEGV